MRVALALLPTLLLATPALADGPRDGWDRDDHRRPGDDDGWVGSPGHGPPPGTVSPGGYGGRGRPGVPPGLLELRDDAGTDVDVYLDGRWVGRMGPAAGQTFPALPGPHTVTVRAGLDGAILLDRRVDLDPGRPVALCVTAPLVRLTLENDGPAPLFVTLTNRDAGAWVMPGERRPVDVPVGRALVTTSIYTLDGLVPLAQHDVVVPYGARGLVEEIGWTPPPPSTVLTLTNRDPTTVRVWVSGQQVAAIAPGSTQIVRVAPGRHRVVVTVDGGRVLYDAPATFAARGRYDVEIHHGLRVNGALALL